MKKELTAAPQPQLQGIDWKLAGIVGAIIGIPAGLLTVMGTNWFQVTIPTGMMISSWIVINRIKGGYFWNGFVSSTMAGIIGWLVYLGFHYQPLVSQVPDNAVKALGLVTAGFLLPMILMIGTIGSWMFGRTRQRVLQAQEKVSEDKKNKKLVNQNRPKKKYKKKK